MNTVAQMLSRKSIPLVSISPDETVLEALQRMEENNIGAVLVLQGDRYLGLMTERDYSRKVVLKGKNSTDTKVEEIMTTDLPVLAPNDSTEHCMSLMSNKNIRYMPVFDKGKLVGIISMSDVVKGLISSQKATIEQLQSYIAS